MNSQEYNKIWYEQNKEKLRLKRKALYESDPEYRNKAKARAAANREAKRKQVVKPAEYTHDVVTASKALNVSTFSLRAWIKKEYCPKPAQYGGKLVFTDSQVALLQSIANFLKSNNYRVETAESKTEFDMLVNLAHLNW